MAKLYFRYAAMNAGKSTALLQVAHNYEERGQRDCAGAHRAMSASCALQICYMPPPQRCTLR